MSSPSTLAPSIGTITERRRALIPGRLRPGPWALAGLGLLVVMLAAYLALGWSTPGDQADMANGKTWIRWLTRNGLPNAYRMPLDYPPVPLYLFALAGAIYQSTVDPSFNERAALASQTMTLLWKLPGITFHFALAGLIYLLASSRGPRTAFLATAAFALNPAAAYDVPHLGQTDPVPATFVIAGFGALVAGRPGLAGVALALGALSKPQAWVLLPLAGWVLLRWFGRPGLTRAVVAGLGVTLVVLLPWIATGRLNQLLRFFEYLSTRSTANTVVSANAHNLWYIPTLVRSEWINDWELLVGPLSYRMAGLALAALWLGLCLLAARRLRRREEIYLVAGALAFGFFMLMVRAHENHSYLALPLLTLAMAHAPARWPLYALSSLGLLLNLVLRDPLAVANWASPPAIGHPLPPLILTGQLLNVGLNFLLLALLAGALRPLASLRSWRQRQEPAGVR